MIFCDHNAFCVDLENERWFWLGHKIKPHAMHIAPKTRNALKTINTNLMVWFVWSASNMGWSLAGRWPLRQGKPRLLDAQRLPTHLHTQPLQFWRAQRTGISLLQVATGNAW